MKSISKTTMVLTAASALLVASQICGRAESKGFYVKVDAGGNWTLDTDLREFFGENTTGARVAFDPGVRFGLDGGYQFCDWFALEAEAAGMANRIKSISGATQIHDATFAHVPFLLNARLQLPTHSPLTPYAGAGLGFSEAIIDADYIEFGNTSFHGAEGHTVFAWQAFAGLRWAFNPNMGLALEYRYFAADSAHWHADEWYGGPGMSDTLAFGRTQTHAVSVAFDFRF